MEFKVESLQASDFDQLYEMLWRSFPNHFEHSPSDYFKPSIEKDPFHSDSHVRILKDGQKIIGTIKIFTRKLWIEGKLYTIGGIANVGTLPEYRGKGLASLLLDDCIHFMEEKGYDLSLLFAGPIPLYEKKGWQSLDLPQYEISDLTFTTKKKSENRMFFRPVSWKLDDSAIFSLHDGFVKDFDFTIERNPIYWTEYLWQYKYISSEIFGVEMDGHLEAYAVVSMDKKTGQLNIHEYAVKNTDFLEFMLWSLQQKFSFKSITSSRNGKETLLMKFLLKNGKIMNKTENKGMMVRNIKSDLDFSRIGLNQRTLFFSGDHF